MVIDWNNKVIIEHLFKIHLKKVVSRLVEEQYQVFQSWIQQKSNIIELYTHFSKIYDSNHEFQECELQAQHAIFLATGCTNITSYNKKISKIIKKIYIYMLCK